MTDARNAVDLEISAKLQMKNRYIQYLNYMSPVGQSRVSRKSYYLECRYKCKGFVQKKDNTTKNIKIEFEFDANSIGRKFHFIPNLAKYTHTQTRVYLLNAFLCIIKFEIMNFSSTQKNAAYMSSSSQKFEKIRNVRTIHEFI